MHLIDKDGKHVTVAKVDAQGNVYGKEHADGAEDKHLGTGHLSGYTIHQDPVQKLPHEQTLDEYASEHPSQDATVEHRAHMESAIRNGFPYDHDQLATDHPDLFEQVNRNDARTRRMDESSAQPGQSPGPGWTEWQHEGASPGEPGYRTAALPGSNRTVRWDGNQATVLKGDKEVASASSPDEAVSKAEGSLWKTGKDNLGYQKHTHEGGYTITKIGQKFVVKDSAGKFVDDSSDLNEARQSAHENIAKKYVAPRTPPAVVAKPTAQGKAAQKTPSKPQEPVQRIDPEPPSAPATPIEQSAEEVSQPVKSEAPSVFDPHDYNIQMQGGVPVATHRTTGESVPAEMHRLRLRDVLRSAGVDKIVPPSEGRQPKDQEEADAIEKQYQEQLKTRASLTNTHLNAVQDAVQNGEPVDHSVVMDHPSKLGGPEGMAKIILRQMHKNGGKIDADDFDDIGVPPKLINDGLIVMDANEVKLTPKGDAVGRLYDAEDHDDIDYQRPVDKDYLHKQNVQNNIINLRHIAEELPPNSLEGQKARGLLKRWADMHIQHIRAHPSSDGLVGIGADRRGMTRSEYENHKFTELPRLIAKEHKTDEDISDLRDYADGDAMAGSYDRDEPFVKSLPPLPPAPVLQKRTLKSVSDIRTPFEQRVEEGFINALATGNRLIIVRLDGTP